jgi:hypothetical protein
MPVPSLWSFDKAKIDRLATAYTYYLSVDPKEDMIVIFMGQRHPTGNLPLDRQVQVLAYQAIVN